MTVITTLTAAFSVIINLVNFLLGGTPEFLNKFKYSGVYYNVDIKNCKFSIKNI